MEVEKDHREGQAAAASVLEQAASLPGMVCRAVVHMPTQHHASWLPGTVGDRRPVLRADSKRQGHPDQEHTSNFRISFY